MVIDAEGRRLLSRRVANDEATQSLHPLPRASAPGTLVAGSVLVFVLGLAAATGVEL